MIQVVFNITSMKTIRFINRAIMAMCLCLGMAACGGDDGDNPSGSGGCGSFNPDVEQSDGGNRIADDGPNSKRRLHRIGLDNGIYDYYITEYDDQGRPSRAYYEAYGDYIRLIYSYPKGNKTIEIIYDRSKQARCCEYRLNDEGLIASSTFYNEIDGEVEYETTYEYDSNGQMIRATYVCDYFGHDDYTYDVTWQDGNITRLAATDNTDGDLIYENKYAYTDELSWKGIVTNSPVPGNFMTDGILLNTTGYFGKRPKNLPYELIDELMPIWEYAFIEDGSELDGYIQFITVVYSRQDISQNYHYVLEWE